MDVIILQFMKLSPGNKLGPYKIIAAAGAGGMGEVYKAEDTRLDRIVAIKILPAGAAISEDRRKRFEREAKAIAGLSNPNICTLHDIGRDNDTDYLVMEYLEGQTLATKLNRGALDVNEALEIGIRLAEALEAAHRRGIVHRDLKPENIMLTDDGPKILDFGLSKIRAVDQPVEGYHGPTETTPLTGEGRIVGTMQYMSPEQIESGEITPRTDIFAFGATLFEMLTGRRAFKGEKQTSLIAAILKEDPPPVSRERSLASPALDRVVQKCLEKNPDARWQSAHDLADELRWISESHLQPSKSEEKVKQRMRFIWPIVTGAAVVISCILVILFLFGQNAQKDTRVRRLIIPVAENGMSHWPRLSPDGRYMAYLAKDSSGGAYQIWVRPLESLEAYPLPGTEGAKRPFWSPDSRSIAFFQNDILKKMPITGGPAQILCKSQGGADGCWNTNGIILFDENYYYNIMQVPASGGKATPAMSKSLHDDRLGWPWFLPDGRHFLYLDDDSLATPTDNQLLKVGALDSDFEKKLTRVDSRVEYAEPGYLVYLKDNVLLAHPFDAEKLSFTGNPIVIDQNISVWNWGANFSLASDGTLAYQKSSDLEKRSQLLWIDRAGKVVDTLGKLDFYRDIALSPDGSLLGYTKLDKSDGTQDVWIFDLDRHVQSRVTFDKDNDIYLGWSKDSRSVIFSSYRNYRYQIFKKRANGLGKAELIYSNPNNFDLTGFGCWANRNDMMYIFEGADPWSYGLLDPDGNTDSVHFHDANYDQYTFGASPDGRYLLYSSNETGEWEVYVRELDSAGGKWRISTTGGVDPVWSQDGTEIFYMEIDFKTIVAVPVDWQEEFHVGRPDRLFTVDIQNTGLKRLRFAPSADGQRFLVNVAVQNNLKSDVVVILNWLSDYGHGANTSDEI